MAARGYHYYDKKVQYCTGLDCRLPCLSWACTGCGPRPLAEVPQEGPVCMQRYCGHCLHNPLSHVCSAEAGEDSEFFQMDDGEGQDEEEVACSNCGAMVKPVAGHVRCDCGLEEFQ